MWRGIKVLFQLRFERIFKREVGEEKKAIFNVFLSRKCLCVVTPSYSQNFYPKQPRGIPVLKCGGKQIPESWKMALGFSPKLSPELLELSRVARKKRWDGAVKDKFMWISPAIEIWKLDFFSLNNPIIFDFYINLTLDFCVTMSCFFQLNDRKKSR